ncbi:MAG: nucleotidyltransferase domain-containing protein [Luteibaculaceae bacterium]
MENKANFYNVGDTGLTKEEMTRIRAVFFKYPQIDKAVLYGSRAMGNYKPASDIDITLMGNRIDLSLLTEIEFDLDDLMLSYKFDITIFDKITNAAFIEHINRVGKEIYKSQ